jgi:hypothetical protein
MISIKCVGTLRICCGLVNADVYTSVDQLHHAKLGGCAYFLQKALPPQTLTTMISTAGLVFITYAAKLASCGMFLRR